jgi:hypothetical protein
LQVVALSALQLRPFYSCKMRRGVAAVALCACLLFLQVAEAKKKKQDGVRSCKRARAVP